MSRVQLSINVCDPDAAVPAGGRTGRAGKSSTKPQACTAPAITALKQRGH